MEGLGKVKEMTEIISMRSNSYGIFSYPLSIMCMYNMYYTPGLCDLGKDNGHYSTTLLMQQRYL